MNRSDDSRLLRDLLGEATEADRGELDARATRDPELARERARLAARWASLELPPPAPVPLGFKTSVLARLRRSVSPPPLFATPWMRAAGLTALLAGMAAGGLLATSQQSTAEEMETLAWDQTSLAEEYLSAQQSADVDRPLAEEAR